MSSIPKEFAKNSALGRQVDLNSRIQLTTGGDLLTVTAVSTPKPAAVGVTAAAKWAGAIRQIVVLRRATPYELLRDGVLSHPQRLLPSRTNRCWPPRQGSGAPRTVAVADDGYGKCFSACHGGQFMERAEWGLGIEFLHARRV